MIKRYLLFCFAYYESSGGLKDCEGSFDSIEEAQQVISKLRADPATLLDECQIFDCETRTVVQGEIPEWCRRKLEGGIE